MSKDKKYRILTIQHLLKNNKIAKSGDLVHADCFINLQDSLNGGFCVLDKVKKSNKKTDPIKDISKVGKIAEPVEIPKKTK